MSNDKPRLTDEEVDALVSQVEEVTVGLFLVHDFPKLRTELERLRKYEADWEAFREAYVALSGLPLASPVKEGR
jgi:hypothetical protein